MDLIARAFFAWLPLGVAVTLLCALISVTVQQNYRQSLNDPQIQMAEDAAAAIEHGASVKSVIPTTTVDISGSLAPWLAVYDEDGNAIGSSGTLNNVTPHVPLSVLQQARTYFEPNGNMTGNNMITWQPAPNVRQAIVVVNESWQDEHYEYVVAGRNMREVETRESNLSEMVFLGWLFTLLAAFVALLFSLWIRGPKAVL